MPRTLLFVLRDLDDPMIAHERQAFAQAADLDLEQVEQLVQDLDLLVQDYLSSVLTLLQTCCPFGNLPMRTQVASLPLQTWRQEQ